MKNLSTMRFYWLMIRLLTVLQMGILFFGMFYALYRLLRYGNGPAPNWLPWLSFTGIFVILALLLPYLFLHAKKIGRKILRAILIFIIRGE